jgi:hypothetical protein
VYHLLLVCHVRRIEYKFVSTRVFAALFFDVVLAVVWTMQMLQYSHARLTTGIRSEKCVVRRFRCHANIIECTYTNLDSIAYYTPRPYGIAYYS